MMSAMALLALINAEEVYKTIILGHSLGVGFLTGG